MSQEGLPLLYQELISLVSVGRPLCGGLSHSLVLRLVELLHDGVQTFVHASFCCDH